MTNEQVITAFFGNRQGRSMNLSTDGRALWSYNVPICKITGGRIEVDMIFYSKTTSKHRNMAIREAKRLGFSIIEKEWL